MAMPPWRPNFANTARRIGCPRVFEHGLSRSTAHRYDLLAQWEYTQRTRGDLLRLWEALLIVEMDLTRLRWLVQVASVVAGWHRGSATIPTECMLRIASFLEPIHAWTTLPPILLHPCVEVIGITQPVCQWRLNEEAEDLQHATAHVRSAFLNAENAKDKLFKAVDVVAYHYHSSINDLVWLSWAKCEWTVNAFITSETGFIIAELIAAAGFPVMNPAKHQ